METNEFNPYRKRLIKKGILSGETRGYVSFTLPLFSEYVLERAAVMLTPGNGYGPNGEGYFRISLTLPEERVAEAAQRLREKLDKVTF